MKYETFIGLEIHAELSTKTKIYCGCKNDFGNEPNKRVCPVCAGFPGALPVLNKKVVEYAIKAGLSLNCTIANRSYFDRKNYFYPDLPKAYQISQNNFPLCTDGYLDIFFNNEEKRIGISRVHIEEDAGKLIHDIKSNTTIIDFNRCGVPLIEIVTKPDMHSPEEAIEFLETLKSTLIYTGISDCKMEEGSLRCDINISVRPIGTKQMGTRCEIKNLNSFSAVLRAIKYETARQTELLDSSQNVVQETRRWDDKNNKTVIMRSKENASDYLYFKEPDLVPIVVSPEWIKKIKATLPELPHERKKRLVREFSIPMYDANIITSSKDLADYFEECVKYDISPKEISNWLMGDVLRIINKKGIKHLKIPFPPSYLAKMISLINNGTISTSAAKKVLLYMFESTKDPEIAANELGLIQISDENTLSFLIKKVLDNNPESISDYKSGKTRAFSFLIGQAMKESNGQANPILLNELMKKALEKN